MVGLGPPDASLLVAGALRGGVPLPPLLGTPYRRAEVSQLQVGTGTRGPRSSPPSRVTLNPAPVLFFFLNLQNGLVLDVPVMEI